MLSFQINWRIKNLIIQLNQLNSTDSLEEINTLLKMNSDENRAALIAALLDEIDFADQRNLINRDPQKVITIVNH